MKNEMLGTSVEQATSDWSISGDNTTRIVLHTRKNRTEPSTVIRTCTCSVNPTLCIHTSVARRLHSATTMKRPDIWTISYDMALKLLRVGLSAIGIPDAQSYGLHAFRRGLARDLLKANTPLKDILAACDWRSSTFAWYMARETIDNMAVLQAAQELSDNEDDESEPPSASGEENKRGSSSSAAEDKRTED